MPGMEKSYKKLAPTIVAIKYPRTKRPTMFKASYNARMWQFMVARADLGKNINPEFIYEDSEEGRQIIATMGEGLMENLLKGENDNITPDLLLEKSDTDLRQIAESYHITVPNNMNRKAIVFKIMGAIEEGAKPKGVTFTEPAVGEIVVKDKSKTAAAPGV